MKTCQISNCTSKSKRVDAGLCRMHSERLRRHGDVNFTSGKPFHMDHELWFWLNTKRVGACLESQFAQSCGWYPEMKMPRSAPIRAHRYAWQSLRGEIPKGLCVCHTCDNPKCVRIEHLWLGSIADNTRDMIKKGRAAYQKIDTVTR